MNIKNQYVLGLQIFYDKQPEHVCCPFQSSPRCLFAVCRICWYVVFCSPNRSETSFWPLLLLIIPNQWSINDWLLVAYSYFGYQFYKLQLSLFFIVAHCQARQDCNIRLYDQRMIAEMFEIYCVNLVGCILFIIRIRAREKVNKSELQPVVLVIA